MIDVLPLEIAPGTTGTTGLVTPIYRYLMQQPEHWLRQAFFVGRPKLPVSRVVESMQVNEQSIEEVAKDWGLPIGAVEEALDYYQRFRDVIDADGMDDLALSEELARQHSGQA